ncbi:hypothetical protein GH714_029863 [Hevea brasiliensis]|uniref:Leucine-rich repeat-containing N-terminal plant-type domain-containing protein n=1 Tax=Hevea brasiliensis TaxID=3981 RepID=A0A6A6N4S8_HEVBR|nr:hypothetical protein GH714_029863 [Hevea brasiliensis]
MLPNWIVNIRTLVFVGISSSGLYGRIPLGFSELPNLKSLDLNSNENLSASASQLFWGSRRKIEEIDFSINKLHGKLPASLGNTTSLIYLDLSNNVVKGGIPSSIVVDLSSNHLKGSIPRPGVEVQLLDFSDNHFSCPLPENIGQIMPNLGFLSISRNQIIGAIPASIGELSSLIALDLSESLGQLNLLQTLHLSDNRLSGAISSALQNLSILETLDLGNNRLIGNIPPWIGEAFPSLRILRLGSNAFYGEIPPALSNLRSLQVLDVAENKLNGTIPASFGNLKAMAKIQNGLHYLFYGRFSFGGSSLHFFQENLNVNINGQPLVYTKILSLLSLLTSIDLSGNNLYGQLPEEITKLVGLVFLNLSRNHISGQIPKSISE